MNDRKRVVANATVLGYGGVLLIVLVVVAARGVLGQASWSLALDPWSETLAPSLVFSPFYVAWTRWSIRKHGLRLTVTSAAGLVVGVALAFRLPSTDAAYPLFVVALAVLEVVAIYFADEDGDRKRDRKRADQRLRELLARCRREGWRPVLLPAQ